MSCCISCSLEQFLSLSLTPMVWMLLMNTGQLFWKWPSWGDLSDVGMIRFTRCNFDRMTAEVRPCLSVVSFILHEITVNAVLIYCTLTVGRHWANCPTCMSTFSSPMRYVPLHSLFYEQTGTQRREVTCPP